MSRSTGSLRSRDGLASARGILTSVLGGLLGWAGIVWAVSRLW